MSFPPSKVLSPKKCTSSYSSVSKNCRQLSNEFSPFLPLVWPPLQQKLILLLPLSLIGRAPLQLSNEFPLLRRYVLFLQPCPVHRHPPLLQLNTLPLTLMELHLLSSIGLHPLQLLGQPFLPYLY